MSTKILSSKTIKELQPAHALWQFYQPGQAEFRFTAKTKAEAKKWQGKTRQALEQLISFDDFQLPESDLSPKLIETVDKGDYIREKILIKTSKYTSLPVYMLIPKGRKGPLPTILAFHGHGYGVKDIVGLWENGEERDTPDGYHRDFGIELCRQGFAVAAPEISCFGEHTTDFFHLSKRIAKPVPTTCAHTAALAFHLGGSALGLRIHDAKKLVDYLETRDDVNTKRLGAMGISGGGMHTFFSTCLDERIKACVVSGYFCPFEDSILAMQHCFCNFVPGLHKFGEIHDLVGLIAPRPMLVEAGTFDPIFPIEGVKKSVRKAREVYKVFGESSKVQTDYFEGRHRINGQKAYPFLQKEI